MDFAGGAGAATLTVRATDPAGLFVDATVTVNIDPPPVIGDFACVEGRFNVWTMSGDVSDNAAPVAGDVVTFGGVLASYNLTGTVAADGTFLVSASLPNIQSGTATAGRRTRTASFPTLPRT